MSLKRNLKSFWTRVLMMNSIYQIKNKKTHNTNPKTVKTINTKMMKKAGLKLLYRITTQMKTRFL